MSASAIFSIVYDLGVPGALEVARRHCDYWGRTRTGVHVLNSDHVVLVFRPADDERWRPWERTRQRWILRDTIATVELGMD